MPVVRPLLLAVIAVAFVTTVSLIFVRDTGLAEKAVLVVIAILLAAAVPGVQRLGTGSTR